MTIDRTLYLFFIMLDAVLEVYGIYWMYWDTNKRKCFSWNNNK